MHFTKNTENKMENPLFAVQDERMIDDGESYEIHTRTVGGVPELIIKLNHDDFQIYIQGLAKQNILH